MAEFPKVLCKDFDHNRQVISDYDILRYREEDIKKLKKKCATRAEFAEELRKEFMWRYWSKAEHELIISRTEDGRILLTPWCGCRDKEGATIDVTDDYSQLDWGAFADHHINKQMGNLRKSIVARFFKAEAKIDVYDQIMFGDRFEKLVDALWTTRFKYERDNPKFHDQDKENKQ